MPRTPAAIYQDGHTIGQLASQWGRSAEFVRGLISSGKLNVDERGVVPNATMREFYKDNPHPLDV
ncbi:hypothetical protein GCM10023340_19470 [Nocardioides marinquilinus]|uniref:DNA-binding protein n=1 Tax=Nocardioides marinquilinus TaxID=1210400 RepID=A0ABP9PIR4_9ACTN